MSDSTAFSSDPNPGAGRISYFDQPDFLLQSQVMALRLADVLRRQPGGFPVPIQCPARATILFALLFVIAQVCRAQTGGTSEPRNSAPANSALRVTNILQFHAITSRDFLDPCPFQLAGTVTMVDTNRGLVVLQDSTAAAALSLGPQAETLTAGQLISVSGSNCCPYYLGFPAFPYQPSGRDICDSFEAPSNWGDYHLTRMRGFLRPPVTGEYTFWIASDNSSELWLSSDDSPEHVRRIAFIDPGTWVNPREWSRFPSQRSETILLRAGRSYYIEAFQEQLTLADHVAVAWQGPRLEQSVIEGRYLTPLTPQGARPQPNSTNGILREYWTNYSAGTLVGLTGPRDFESALSLGDAQVRLLGQSSFPAPIQTELAQPILADENYRWVSLEGQSGFFGGDADALVFELTDGSTRAEVRVAHWSPSVPRPSGSKWVRVEGVCEGVRHQDGSIVPALIWVPTERQVSSVAQVGTNLAASANQPDDAASPEAAQASQGFYQTPGVVTFNGHAMDGDYFYVQQGNTATFVSQSEHAFGRSLQVGHMVQIGGFLVSGRFTLTLNPMIAADLGRRPMPVPLPLPDAGPLQPDRDGKWTEAAGVVHSLNPDGTLSLAARPGPLLVWIGGAPANELRRCVNSRLALRGVLAFGIRDAPVLLVPSPEFVEVLEPAPASPFEVPRSTADSVAAIGPGAPPAHRVRIAGTVTYHNGRTMFVQDASGGVRVLGAEPLDAKVGEGVELVGFPRPGTVPTLTDALLRPTGDPSVIEPAPLNPLEASNLKYAATLVSANGTFLTRHYSGNTRVLELQENQQMFEADLADNLGDLADIPPGSRIRVTGVCDFDPPDGVAPLGPSLEKPATALHIHLRSPEDVAVMSSPSWWTWQRTATIGGTLVTVILAALLWVHLLHRRLQRQQAARLAFSRQILHSQETERQRIAANLHDGLGQDLLVIKNQAHLAMAPGDVSVLQQRLTEISELASQAIEEVRQITRGLRPYQLDRLGLSQAIRAIVKRASDNSRILFASNVDDVDNVFDKESEIHVFRIVQEAVNNIVKHSEATEATVVVRKEAGAVLLSIRDNGRGFDPGAPSPGRGGDVGHGLGGITERARILGGSVAIDSQLGQGTSLTVQVPLSGVQS
jgi:signal transduction histidine kinase